jgi:hypothetical protein
MVEHNLIPEPEPEEFVEDIKNNYLDDRWSDVGEGSHNEPQTVMIVSAEHPAYTRFISDIKPYLYHHGFALSTARRDYRTYMSDEDIDSGYHLIKGVSIQWIIAEAQGYTCNRGACTRLADPEDGWYCEQCSPRTAMSRIEETQRTTF